MKIFKNAKDKNVAARVIYINGYEYPDYYAYSDSACTIKMTTSQLKEAFTKRAVIDVIYEDDPTPELRTLMFLTIEDSIAKIACMGDSGIEIISSVADSVGPTQDEPDEPEPVDPMTLPYLTFTSKTDDFNLWVSNKTWDGTVEYSTDANTWSTLNTETNIPSVNKKLYLRGKNNTKFSAYMAGDDVGPGLIFKGPKYDTDHAKVPVDCSGNINTLLDYEYPLTAVVESKCFTGFFRDSSIVTPPALPATMLADNCYNSMFYGCTSLTSAPELPATSLADSCYSGMFSGCTSLTSAPALPATSLAESCYSGMFSGCTSLTSAPALPATSLAESCYRSMFYGCTSLTTAPALPATTLAGSCYHRMFYGCTSLKVSETQTEEYTTAWRIPSTGEIAAEATSWNTDMFIRTGGTFTSAPSINSTYYIIASSIIAG